MGLLTPIMGNHGVQPQELSHHLICNCDTFWLVCIIIRRFRLDAHESLAMLRVSPTRVAPVERREFRDLDLFRQELGKCVNRLFEHEYGVPAATSAP